MLSAGRDQVLGFRLDSQNLAVRLPAGALLEAVAACGLQNTPPGSAPLALQARVSDLTQAEVTAALQIDKTLLEVWSVRGAAYFIRTADAAVFSIALLPDDEESLRFSLQGYAPVLQDTGMSAMEAVEHTAAALDDVLDGRVLTKPELSARVTERLPEQLRFWCQGCGSRHVSESLLRLVALQGKFCLAPRQGTKASFVRTESWLGSAPPTPAPDEARAEIVRRYLRCYGSTTVSHVAEWAGIAPAHARRLWRLVEPELARVDFDGRRTWLLASDVSRLQSPPIAAGVRLLPPHDPYLLQRDRETLVPDKALRPRVWRSISAPGVVLMDGRLVGTWRQQKKGKRLLVTMEPFVPLAQKARSDIETEAQTVARYRGSQSAEVAFTD